MTRQIAILLFEDVAELDAVGPWEVLSWWTRHHPDDGWVVNTMAHSCEPVRCAKGMHIVPDYAISEMPRIEVLVHPGGFGTQRLAADEGHLEWLRGLARDSTLMTSVGTGEDVYSTARLLRPPATTQTEKLDLLTVSDRTLELRPILDRRLPDEDAAPTGVSAGIDMALDLVRRLAGDERAQAARRALQYAAANDQA